jgi:deoxycitidine kinase/deoxyguanosine kinase
MSTSTASATATVTPIIITLDGNIGAGKSTLLAAIRDALPTVTVIPEPVGEWLTMTNQHGESLLELFYRDTPRWAYTFQNCAILTRLLDTQKILKEWKPVVGKVPIIITERSVLTDRYVFADMLHSQGKMDDLEWNLYLKWFHAFAEDLPVKGIIHLTTSVRTSKDRIRIRDRVGEGAIPEEYLTALDDQHAKWIRDSDLPALTVSTEPGVLIADVVKQVEAWIQERFLAAPTTGETEKAKVE